MARYEVQFQAFKTGEWYTKTDTDSKPAAYSVASRGNFGRACRLIDTETGKVLVEYDEDEGMKAINGMVYKNQY